MFMMESWSYVNGETMSVRSETIPSCENFFRSNNDLINVFENKGVEEFVFQEFMDLTENEIYCEIKGSSVDSSNSVCLDDDSKYRVFSNIVESNGREPSFVDLKLGRFDNISGNSKGIPVMLSSESFRSTKRMRMRMNSRPVHCIVFGCRKDLSSSKEYHKRHKVCEVHFKAASVIVNGRIQRFCQQCSRFHLLAEFDNGKRSCRKRLQGHNERRRKPQAGSMGDEVENAIKPASSIRQDTLPSSLMQPEKNVANEWCGWKKVEDETSFSPQSSVPTTERDPQSAEGPRYGSCLLYQNASLGSKQLSTFRALTTCHALSKIAKSGRALSLLSPRYVNSPSHPLGIPSAHYNTSQVSEETVMVSPQASNCEVSDQYVSSGASSTEEINFSPILNFEAATDMDSRSSDNDTTIDWLQLSLHLQRVEQQKQSMIVKRESN